MEWNLKKQLKRAFLAFFGDISVENLNKTVIAQISFPCYDTKSFATRIVLASNKWYLFKNFLQEKSFCWCAAAAARISI